MAVRQITTRLAIDGEQEYKKQLAAVNRELGNLGAEMKLVDAQFKGQANSSEALRAKHDLLRQSIEQQTVKVESLKDALEEAKQAYTENDARTDSYRRQLLSAETALAKLNDELVENEKYLDEAEQSADGCAKSIDGFGKAVKEAADETGTLPGPLGDIQNALKDLRNEDGSFNLSNLTGALSTIKGALVGGAIVTGAKEVIDAIFEIVNSTEEYRESMGKLDVAFEQNGYSLADAEAAYKRFYEITGDTGASVTAANNLASLGLEFDQLQLLIEAVSGAYVSFGDSIPIDSLSESIVDTVSLGKVTGSLADVLNRLGMSEEMVNKELEAMPLNSQKLLYIFSIFATSALPETAEEYDEAAASVIAMRDAQLELNAAMAELGELLSPLASDLVQFGADVAGVAADIIEKIEYLVTKAQEAKQAIDELAERNAAVGVAKESLGWIRDISLEGMVSQIPFLNIPYNIYKGAKWLSGSHAAGLDRVPYDGYLAELHADEAVLNAQEAALWRSAARYGASGAPSASTPAPSPATAQSAARRENVTIDVTLELDGQTLARKQYPLMQAEGRRRGTPLAGKEGT
jgi:hypothetical protein